MRLDEKPYLGEPITVLEIAANQVTIFGDFAIRENGERVNFPKTTTFVALGYDFACPDWRERLARVLERLGQMEERASAQAARLDGIGARRCADRALAELVLIRKIADIIRDEFELEEGEAG